MHARFRILRSRWEAPSSSFLLIGSSVILLSVTGCQSPDASSPAQASAKSNFGPPIQDVRTEAKILELENWYTAEKNSQPTHQHEIEADAAKQAQKKPAKDKTAQSLEKTNPE